MLPCCRDFAIFAAAAMILICAMLMPHAGRSRRGRRCSRHTRSLMLALMPALLPLRQRVAATPWLCYAAALPCCCHRYCFFFARACHLPALAARCLHYAASRFRCLLMLTPARYAMLRYDIYDMPRSGMFVMRCADAAVIFAATPFDATDFALRRHCCHYAALRAFATRRFLFFF